MTLKYMSHSATSGTIDRTMAGRNAGAGAKLVNGEHVRIESPTSDWRGKVGLVCSTSGERVEVQLGGHSRRFLPRNLQRVFEDLTTSTAQFCVGDFVAVDDEFKADTTHLAEISFVNVTGAAGGVTYTVLYDPFEPECKQDEEVAEDRIHKVPARLCPRKRAEAERGKRTVKHITKRYPMSELGSKQALLVADTSPGSGLADVDRELTGEMEVALTTAGFTCTTLECPTTGEVRSWLQRMLREAATTPVGCVFLFFAGHGDESGVYTSCTPSGHVQEDHCIKVCVVCVCAMDGWIDGWMDGWIF